jgi:adenosylmethionine-8-amino-7-oxononanoate aminotransferase
VPHYSDSSVFYRDLRSDLPLIVQGEGCWLVDDRGKRYLDGSGGAYVASIGHGVREIGEAMAHQASRIAYVSGAAFTNESVEALAACLTRLAPEYSHAYVLGSGSEAVEAALKLARQYQVERGRGTRHKVIALAPSYHGNTMLALSASAREHYRKFWSSWMVDIVRMRAPYAYRCGCAGDPGCPACSGELLDEVIRSEGAESVAAFIVEPVGGSSTGANVPRESYFRTVREICDRHDVLLVADEVLCGAGRTGTWTALEQWGVSAEITTFGKGISGGYAPVSAVLAKREIVDTIAAGTGHLVHAQTFSHHPVTCAAAVAALDHLEKHRLVERCRDLGPELQQRLQRLAELPCVGDVRGRGLLAGIELVADKTTREPFSRSLRFAETLTRNARANGLVVWPNVGHADGTRGDLVCVAPPFIITVEEIDEMVRRLGAAIAMTLETLGTSGIR